MNAFASGTDQDDLMQEMMICLWKALPVFRGDSKESTFTYRVVNNCALTWIRGQNRRRARETKAFKEPTFQTETEEPKNWRLELLYECIRELPSVDRSIITMSLDGLNHSEIGEVLGSSGNAVAVRIHRIRKQLSETIERKGKTI